MASNKGFPMMKLEFMGQFQELLKLSLRHDFFNSGDFPQGVVLLRPTAATIEVLSRNSLQYRSTPSGGMLGYGKSDVYTPLKNIAKPLQLSFFIELSDIKFFNYTELPYVFEEDKMFYFNNKALEKETTDHKNLSKAQYVAPDDKIEVSSSLITYTFDTEQYGTEVQIMNALEEVVFEKIVPDGSVSCEISLLGQPEGKYSLLIDGLEEKTFFVYNGMKTPFGVIDIFIDKDDFGDYSFFDQQGEIIKQEYNIHFGARAVRWQYLLVETGADQMHFEHEAYDTNKAVSFKPAQESQLESGKKVYTIWTSDKIPFKEKQKQKFKLKTKRGKSAVEWVIELPCATALGNLKINLLDKKEVFSELIVYL